MIRQRYTVQTITQTNEGGDPIGSLSLAPVVEPVATEEGSATSSRALSPAPNRATRMSYIPVSGIPLDELIAEGLNIGDTVTITVSKESV